MSNSNFVALSLIFCLSLMACSKPSVESEPSEHSTATDNPSSESKQKPNILLVVVDDLGFTDLGSFGGEIATPNLDELANKGTKLSNFYTAPTCSPTRAMLLTGIDHHLVGIGAMKAVIQFTNNLGGQKGYEGYLTDRAASLPEVLKSEGYDTFMAGKWHLGFEEDQSPSARGFDKTFTLLDGGAGHFNDMGMFSPKATFRENGELISALPEDFYSTEFYTQKIQQYIIENRTKDKPFFAYLSYTAPHWPLQALPESIELFEGKYDEGYDVLHERRIEAGIKAGVIPANTPRSIPKTKWMRPWNELTEEEKRLEARRMEIYAAMIHDIDVNIGRLMKTLEQENQLDNTIIFFMSDNGAEGNNAELTMKMVQPYINACCNNDFDNLGKADSYIFAGPNWARASVGASSFYKGVTAEGGIKAPAFIVYPNMANSGSSSQRFVTVKDVMPTLLELSGINLPNGVFNGRAVLPIEGRSLLQPQDEDTVLMGWELHGAKAIRSGYWKLVSLNSIYGDGSWKLYNLKDDPSELNDLAPTQPEKVAEMIELYDEYAASKGVIEPDFKIQF